MKFRTYWVKEPRRSWNDSARPWYLYRTTCPRGIVMFFMVVVAVLKNETGALSADAMDASLMAIPTPQQLRNVDRS